MSPKFKWGLLFVFIFLIIPIALTKDEKCLHATDYNDQLERCLPIETEKSTLGDLTLHVTGTEVELNLQQTNGNAIIFSGQMGLDLPLELGQPTPCSDGPICWHWGSAAKLFIDQTSDGVCYNVHWKTNILKSLEDCFDLSTNHHWFVGPEEYEQHFPLKIENERKSVPFLPGDMLQDRYRYFGGVTEPYWLSSKGVAVWLMDDDVTSGQPLFFSWNDSQNQKMCAKTKNGLPYSLTVDEPVSLSYKICARENAQVMHQYAVKNLLGLPEGIPDEIMITSPIWSSWAQYKADINESVILDFARLIRAYGFSSSQIEIDDNWESCYGEATFDTDKFPNPTVMVKKLKEDYQFRVTLWIHPFINLDCPSWYTAATPPSSFLVRDTNGKEGIGRLPGLVWWWQGVLAGYLDFTNPEAVNWWRSRLETLRTEIGIDSFKFDAGEVNWMPSSFLLNEGTSKSLWPVLQTTKYVESVAHFGRQIEVRVGYRSQRHPIFVRMLDKDSRWGYDNGLKTLIPTLLQISMSGYPFVLPDMIGGNGYQMDDDPLHTSNPPTKELFVRWLQANTFMPAMQFSFVPWIYDEEVVGLAKKFISIHEDYSPMIIALAHEATKSGNPINRPIWWNDPTDEIALTIDSEFLLGDSILVAPVLDEGATSRDIYFPSGRWQDQVQEGQVYEGPVWIREYPAPLDTLPYFTKL